MAPLPVYVFDSRDNRFCKWPRLWFLRTMTENAATYVGWEVVVGEAYDFIYAFATKGVLKQSYGGSHSLIGFPQFLEEISHFVQQYDKS